MSFLQSTCVDDWRDYHLVRRLHRTREAACTTVRLLDTWRRDDCRCLQRQSEAVIQSLGSTSTCTRSKQSRRRSPSRLTPIQPQGTSAAIRSLHVCLSALLVCFRHSACLHAFTSETRSHTHTHTLHMHDSHAMSRQCLRRKITPRVTLRQSLLLLLLLLLMQRESFRSPHMYTRYARHARFARTQAYSRVYVTACVCVCVSALAYMCACVACIL